MSPSSRQSVCAYNYDGITTGAYRMVSLLALIYDLVLPVTVHLQPFQFRFMTDGETKIIPLLSQQVGVCRLNTPIIAIIP